MKFEKLYAVVEEEVATRRDELVAAARDKLRAEVVTALQPEFERMVQEKLTKRLQDFGENAMKQARDEVLAALNSKDKASESLVVRGAITRGALTGALNDAATELGRLVKLKRGKWYCARPNCQRPAFGSQRAATMHARSCTPPSAAALSTTDETENKVSTVRSTKKRVLRGARRRQCLNPDCKKASSGPRFHHLCVDHRGASKKQIAEWKRTRRNAAMAIARTNGVARVSANGVAARAR